MLSLTAVRNWVTSSPKKEETNGQVKKELKQMVPPWIGPKKMIQNRIG